MARLAPALLLLLFFAACPGDDGPVLDPPELIAPADGSTISQNPPTLVWHGSSEEQIIYLLEIATDSLFSSGTVIYYLGPVTPPDTQYTLPDTLTANTYYWRACVREDC